MRDPKEPLLWLLDAILLFILLLWIMQLFLLMTGLDAFLARERQMLWPAAIGSLVLAVMSLALVRFSSRQIKAHEHNNNKNNKNR
jgi:membrane protein implicated in regulation of membrane protease activity